MLLFLSGISNRAPDALPATIQAVEDGAVVTGQLLASDPDGTKLTFSPVLTFAPGVAGLTINTDGSFSFDPSDPEYQGLAEGETIELLGGYFVSDGQLTDSSTLTITLAGTNDDPVFEPSIMEFAVSSGMSEHFHVAATDVDGDLLEFFADDPENGTVHGGEDGNFTYEPDPGFDGTDIVRVSVSDGNGGQDTMSFVATVHPPLDSGLIVYGLIVTQTDSI